MPKQITFEGKVYSFPDDATDDEISEALSQPSQAAVNPNAPNPITTAMQQSTRGINQRFAEQRRGFQYIPTGMGIAPPSNLMRTPSGMYVENPRVERPEDTLEGYGRTLAYALSPYVTAGALGAAAGSPSGVGIIPGAILGTGSVLLSDLASSLYNAVGPQFGGPKIGYASDVIRNAYANAVPNLVAPPETTGQRYLYSAANAAAGGLTGASAFKEAAKVVGPGLVRNVMTTLGGGTPATNLVASGTAGLSGQAAREFNAPPIVQFGAELFGGALGAYGATGVNAMRRGGVAGMQPDQAQLTQEAIARRNQLYSDMEAAGVRYNKTDIRNLIDDFETRANTGLIPGLASAPPELRTALTLIRAQLRTGNANLSGPRQLLELIDTFENAATTGRMPVLAGEFRRMIDDLMADPASSRNVSAATTPAEIAQAQQDVATQNALRTQATEAAQRVYRAEQFDPVVEKIAADIANGVDPAKAVQTNLRTLAKNTEFMRFATPTQKAAVLAAVQGDLPQNILRAIGSFSPGSPGLRGQLGQILTYGGMGAGLATPLFAPAMLAPVVGGAIGAGTSAARQAANVSAEVSLNRLGELLKTGAMPPKPPSMRPGLATAVGTTAAVATPKETEAKREERELAKPKTKLNIIETPANDKEVQRMLRVARDIIEDPDFGKKYTLPEIVKLYNVLYDAGEAGYSDVIPFADELGNYYDQRSEFENRVKQLGAPR